MNNFIKRILLFVILTIPFYFFTLIVTKKAVPHYFSNQFIYETHNGYGHTHTRLSQADTVTNVDILFLGSSHSYRGFDSRIFKNNGWSSFNLGTSAQSPMQTQTLLKRYLHKINPKLVIYEVYPPTFKIDGIESTSDIIGNDHNDFHSLKMSFLSGDIRLINTFFHYIYLEKYHKDFFNIPESIQKGKDMYVDGGYVERKISYKTDTLRNHTKQVWKSKPENMKYFDKNIKMLNDHDIKYILIFAPISDALYHSYSNINDFNNVMNRKGLYYNFNQIMNLNDSAFYDENHLNQIGVKAFNNQMIVTLNLNEWIRDKDD